MATGRTKQKWFRLYADGYDLSGMSRDIGPFGLEHDAPDLTVWTDQVKGYLKGHTQTNLGAYNAVFDNTATTGLQAVLNASGQLRNVLIAMGIRAAPANGDPCFGGQFLQSGYQAQDDGGALVVNIPFAGWDASSVSLQYAAGFGQLLHANSAETGVNSSAGFDNLAGAVSTGSGGVMVYHVLASSNAAHTATLKVQDAAVNADGSFADLSSATTGVITVTAGVSGMVALSATATVRQYLRWQIVLGTATSVTFLLAFMRG